MGNYELLTGQIVPGIKLAVPDRVRLLSRVVSEPALWVEVPTQVRPYSSGRVGTDPIVQGLSYVRVGFFHVMPHAAHRTQLIWPSILRS